MTTSVGSLILLDQPWELTLQELDPGRSLVTGTPLQRRECTLMVRSSDTHERLLDELTDASRDAGFIADTDGNHWKVTRSNYSYQDKDDPRDIVYTHEIQIEEKEQLNLERIELAGLSLTPERWSLEAKEGSPFYLAILATLSTEENQIFEATLKSHDWDRGSDYYFPVTCVGFSAEPIAMRFGHCLWQRLADGFFRHRIILVSKNNDNDPEGKESPFALLGQPEKDRVAEQSIIARRKVDLLIDELRTSGILSDAAAERIHTEAEEISFADSRELNRAKNVEDFFD